MQKLMMLQSEKNRPTDRPTDRERERGAPAGEVRGKGCRKSRRGGVSGRRDHQKDRAAASWTSNLKEIAYFPSRDSNYQRERERDAVSSPRDAQSRYYRYLSRCPAPNLTLGPRGGWPSLSINFQVVPNLSNFLS